MWRGLGQALSYVGRFVWGLVSLPSRLMTIVSVVALISGGWTWYQFFQQSPPVSYPRSLGEAAKAACEQVPPVLPRPQRAMAPALVLPLVDDRELLVSKTLCECLAQQGWYRPTEKALLDRFLDGLFERIGQRREPVSDPAVAVNLAKAASAEVVLFGRVEQLELLDGRAAVTVQVQALAVDGTLLLEKTGFSNKRPTAVAASGPRVPWWPLAGLLILSLALPPALVPLMRRVLRAESNVVTLLAILLITAVPATVAWPLVFSKGGGTWKVVGFGLLVALECLWCTAVMSHVAEEE
jgi:hypothetical protein